MRDKREKGEPRDFDPGSIDELREFIAEMPAAEQWSLDETVAHILALSESERGLYYAALIHDWRAWRLAMERFGRAEKMSSWADTSNERT
jgi:hypothetical protein